MARFYLPKKNLRDNRGLVDGQELAHLRKVLRLVPGDRVTVFDDSGWEHEAVIRQLSAQQGEIEILRSYEAGRESSLQVTFAVALTKGDKMDFVVEKATELGVQTIVPFTSAFSVPKLDERKIATRTERWGKIALSAVKQCGRTRVPEIRPLHEFHALVSGEWPVTLKLFFSEKEQRQSLHQAHAAHSAAQSVLVAVGPEGGFSVHEAELAQAHGFVPVQLGRRVLRAETAALAALSLVQFLWGDLQ
ncbi:MAG TPA: 16S rRNA (uracil(1498)-N(3))-methyltransferase [Candidatus Binatia bacterium]|jgi:16S rRNA (uracil1498-N3)-methyltransferase